MRNHFFAPHNFSSNVSRQAVAIAVLMFVTFFPVWISQAEEKRVNDLTLQAAVDLAIQDNPNLDEILARSEAMSAIPSQLGTLPDPVISFNALNMPTDSFDMSQEAMTQMQFGLTQAFPFPGKLALREEASSFAAKAAADNVDEARLQLVQNVKIRWWQLYSLDHALEIVVRNQVLFRQLIQVASIKYEVGKGLQQDVLLAQLELSKLHDQQIQLIGLRAKIVAQLNRLIARPANIEISLPVNVATELPVIADETTLYKKADNSRPLLRQLRNEVSGAKALVSLAKKDLYPDFKVGAFYGIRKGDNPPSVGGERSDFLSVKLSMNLPVFSARKQDKAVAQKSSELQQKHYKQEDAMNGISVQISEATADFKSSKEQFLLLKDGILPQARQTVDSMLSGYQVNKVDFLNLVRSQVTLLNYENQYWQSLSEANKALARLAAAVGEENVYE
jgi:cobalt-zinc-cadmium efflux system outer membrane protein